MRRPSCQDTKAEVILADGRRVFYGGNLDRPELGGRVIEYLNADVILILFSLVDPSSLSNVFEKWYQELKAQPSIDITNRHHQPPSTSIPIVLVRSFDRPPAPRPAGCPHSFALTRPRHGALRSGRRRT